jgi:competence protein ComEC
VHQATGSGDGAKPEWMPVGGRLGIIVGGSTLVAAWATSPLLPDGMVAHGIDDRVGLMALAAVVLLGIALVALGMLGYGMRSRSVGPPWATSLLAVAAGSLVVVRLLTHEIGGWVDHPASGGVDPIVRITGRVTEPLVPFDSLLVDGGEATGRFDDRTRWRSEIDVMQATHPGLIDRRLTVGLDVEDARIVPGAAVTLFGRLAIVPPPRNPGELDRRRGRRDRVTGLLVVPSAGLIEVDVGASVPTSSTWLTASRRRWWSTVDQVDRAVASRQPSARGVISAILLGDRRLIDESIGYAAEDAGVAPMLAISGWHLAIIGGFVSVVVGRHRPLGRWLAWFGIIAFALAVAPGAGVRRAAMMVAIGGVAMAFGRRGRGLPIVLIAGAALVWIDPDIVVSVGFRLSLIATIALIVGAGPARRRWFAGTDGVGRRRRSMVRDRWTLAVSASVVAWTSTAPMVLASFGRLSLAGIPAMVLVTPLFAAVVIVAIIAALFTMVAGACPVVVLDLAAALTGAFVAVVEGIAAIAPIVQVPTMEGAAWFAVIPAVALALAPTVSRSGRRRSIIAAALVSTIAAVVWASSSASPLLDRVRVDAIAVGDGTAILVRGGGAAVLQDAGSSSVEDCGRRIIVPTARSLGLRRLDALVVTHANADHFNAVTEVVRRFDVGRVLVTPQLLRRARSDRESPIAVWLDRMHTLGVEIAEVARGDTLRFGDLVWSVRHPDRDDDCRTVNDESIVSTVGLVGDASPRLLLCGDVQDEAIARIMAREPRLSASVMELPHHGSWRPIAAVLLARVDPGAVVQSTGPDRWRMDRWKDACAGRWRGVTCRDGLVSFEIDGSGRVHAVGSGSDWVIDEPP